MLKQSNGLEFVYDNAGVVGVKYNGAQYFYRKDAQGNIIAILNTSGTVVTKYDYDAWGNLSVSGSNTTLGNLNPFRYRGYYYDTETKLYYLQTRYYDPEVGRFISQDSLEYADPETINGLNLYAYCDNNPVNNVDPTGEFFFSFLATLLTAAIIGAAVGAAGTFVGDLVTSALCGEWKFSSWETYLGNSIGGAIGGMVSLINPFAGTVIAGTIGTFAGLAIGKATGSNSMPWEEIGIFTAVSFGISLCAAGMTQYLKIPGVTKGSHSWQQVFKAGFTKVLRYDFSMSAKTLAKGAGYLLVSSFTTGFAFSNVAQAIFGFVYNKIKDYFNIPPINTFPDVVRPNIFYA